MLVAASGLPRYLSTPRIRLVKRSARPLWLSATLASFCACGSQSHHIAMSELAAEHSSFTPQEAVAFRIPHRSSEGVGIYRLPSLTELPWRIPMPRTEVTEVVGYSSEGDLIYLIGDSTKLYAIDLTAGLTRMIDSSIHRAALGLNGVPYVILASGAVGSVEQRQVSIWIDSAVPQPAALWGAAGGNLLTELRSETGRSLVVFRRDREPARWTIPEGFLAVSRWADAVAVLTPDKLHLFETRTPDRVREIRTDSRTTGAVFSPSGHRLYIVTESGRLAAIDRYNGGVLKALDLPFPPSQVRMDPYGRFLLLRHADADLVLIVEVLQMRTVGTLPVEWTDDLPTIAPDGTILAKRGNDIVTYESESLTEVASVTGVGNDRWLVAGWAPREPTLGTQDETDLAPEGQEQGLVFIQVSSTSNREWAEDLSVRLRRAGLDASILMPQEPDEPYRVVLGPFSDQSEAEATAQTLDRPYWIFSVEPSKEF